MKLQKQYLLQFGLALVFIYAGVSSFIHPFDWIGFVPSWVTTLGVSRIFALHLHAGFEILLAALFLANFKIRWVAWLAVVDLAVIILINGFGYSVFEVTFRDMGLFFTALYLALL